MDSKQIEASLDEENKYKSSDSAGLPEDKINIEQSTNRFIDSAGRIVDKEIKGLEKQNDWDVMSSKDILAIKDPKEQLAAASANIDKILESFGSKPVIVSEALYEKVGLKNDLLQIYKSWNYDEKLITRFAKNYYDFRGSGKSLTTPESIFKAFAVITTGTGAMPLAASLIEKREVNFFHKDNIDKLQKGMLDSFYKLGVSTKSLDGLFSKYNELFIPELSSGSESKPDSANMGLMYRFYLDLDNLVGNTMKENIAKGVDVSGLTKLRSAGLNEIIDVVGYLKSGYTGNYHEQIQDMKKRGVKVYSSQLDDK